MDELIAHVVAIVRGMWRRRWAGLLAAWVVAVLGAIGLLRVPDRYEATARVYVDTKSVLKPLMSDLAVEPDIDQTIGLLARTLITRPNVELLMTKSNLDPKSMPPAEREMAVSKLMREIQVSGGGRDNVFSFSYRHSDPQHAHLVVSNLVSLFVESDLGAKQRDTDAARQFIDEQIQAYEVRLAEAESRLKDFKVRNLGVTSGNGADYFARMSALTEEMGRLNLELRAAEQARESLKRELGGEVANLLPDPATTPAAPLSSPELDVRLDAQRKTLDELMRRYTELHPDVVTTRKLIARLEEQKREEAEAQRRAAAARPVSVATSSNPMQQQIKIALAEAEAAVASLRVRVDDTQARLSKLRASASRVPQVEAELAQLNRDYEIVRRNYEAMVGKREKASLSEEVDATRLANFRIIDPPRTGSAAVFPNRLALAPLVLLLALAVGAAASYLVSQIFPTFDNARALRNATQRPVAGSISMLMTPRMTRRARGKSLAFATALGGLVMGYGAWIVSMTPIMAAS